MHATITPVSRTPGARPVGASSAGTAVKPAQVLVLSIKDEHLERDIAQWQSTCNSRGMELSSVRLDELKGFNGAQKQEALRQLLKELKDSGRINDGTVVVVSMHGEQSRDGYVLTGEVPHLEFEGASLMRDLRRALPANLMVVTACYADLLKRTLVQSGGNTFVLAGEEATDIQDARVVVDKMLECLADQISPKSAQENESAIDGNTMEQLWKSVKQHSGEQVRWIGQRTRLHKPASNSPAKADYQIQALQQDRRRLDKLARTLNAQLMHGTLDSVKALLGPHPKPMLDLIEENSSVTKHQSFLSYVARSSEKDTREKLEFLLSLGPANQRLAALNEQDQYEQTLLHDACDQGNLDAVTALLEMGADVSIKDEDGASAFDVAKRSAKGVLLRHMAAWGTLAQFEALQLDKALVESADADGNTALCHAFMKGNLRAAQYLLAQGANADCKSRDGQSLLQRACDLGDPQWVRLLLGYCRKADLPAAMASTIEAIATGRPGMTALEVLLAAGAAPDALAPDGRALLSRAADLNLVPVVRRLVEQGASAQLKMSNGQTLLAWLEQRGKTDRKWSEIHQLLEARQQLRR